MLETLSAVLRGPEAVRWAWRLYGNDVEFTFAIDEGVSSDVLRWAAEESETEAEFRERVVNAYFGGD